MSKRTILRNPNGITTNKISSNPYTIFKNIFCHSQRKIRKLSGTSILNQNIAIVMCIVRVYDLIIQYFLLDSQNDISDLLFITGC